MRDLHNIEKSGFRRTEYVGWNNKGDLYFIRGIGSPLGKWVARNRDNVTAAPIFAHSLQELSSKLERIT